MQAAIANQRSTMQSIRFISMKRTCFKSDFYDISYLFQIKVIKHSSSSTGETIEPASSRKNSSTAAERQGLFNQLACSLIIFFCVCDGSKSSENLEMKAFEKFENAVFFLMFKIPSDRQLILV